VTPPIPTPLSAVEHSWLEWVLPEHSAACMAMRKRIEGLALIGGRSEENEELVFGNPGDAVDSDFAPAAVFAIGVIVFPKRRVTLTVHDEADGQIAVRISPRISPNGEAEIRRWSLSHWAPGAPGPERGADVRLIGVAGTEFVLALCPAERRLWLHDRSVRHNRLLPATAIYNHLMQVLNIRDGGRVLAPERLFSDHTDFSDIDFIRALRRYGERSGRITLPDAPQEVPGSRGFLRHFLDKFTRHA